MHSHTVCGTGGSHTAPSRTHPSCDVDRVSRSAVARSDAPAPAPPPPPSVVLSDAATVAMPPLVVRALCIARKCTPYASLLPPSAAYAPPLRSNAPTRSAHAHEPPPPPTAITCPPPAFVPPAHAPLAVARSPPHTPPLLQPPSQTPPAPTTVATRTLATDAPIGARSPTQPFARTQTHPPQNTTLPTPVHTIGFEGAASSLPAVS